MNKIYTLLFILNTIILSSQDITPIWEIALPGKVLSTPLERERGDLIISCDDRRLYSIDILTGKINWKVKPGGKLEETLLSKDGSIIVRDGSKVYSLYSNGSLRWEKEFLLGIKSFCSSETGDIYLLSGRKLFKINRFGKEFIILNIFDSDNIYSLNNSLLCYYKNNEIVAITNSGINAWSYHIEKAPTLIRVNEDKIFIVYSNGLVEIISDTGLFMESIPTENINPVYGNFNENEDLLIIGDRGTSLVSNHSVSKLNNMEHGLYYSNGITVKSNSSWILSAFNDKEHSDFFPSGKKQVEVRTITLSDKRVWKNDKFKEYYRRVILDNNREIQLQLLSEISSYIGHLDILDKYPNFYEILLLASSNQNVNIDVRQEAYKIIGKSKDISFIPYLLTDLEGESSYLMITYIYFALGQIGVDKTGNVVSLIVSRVDDYHDENYVLNALYALYYINNYTNGEFVDTIFNGIEKILHGGYSKNIENRCYEIIKKIK